MNNSTDAFSFFNEEFYTRIGSTKLSDFLYIYLLTPLCVSGILLNILSVIILFKIKIEQTKLYKYLIMYSLNSILFCFVCLFIFIPNSPRFFQHFTSLFARVYKCVILTCITSVLLSIGNFLDIIIGIDRLAIFDKKFNFVTKYSLFRIFCIIFVLSILVNFPVYFSYYVKSDEQFLSDAKLKKLSFRYCGRTEFFKSSYGSIFTMLHLLLRDWLTLICEIITSYLSISNYRKFLAMTRRINPNRTEMNIISVGVIGSGLNIDYDKNKKWKRKNEKGRQLLLMTIILSGMSIVSHVIISVVTVFSLNATYSLLLHSLNICYFVLVLKHNLNFFIFFCFNTNFRRLIRFNNIFASVDDKSNNT